MNDQTKGFLLLLIGVCLITGVLCMYPPIPIEKLYELAKAVVTFFGLVGAILCIVFGVFALVSS